MANTLTAVPVGLHTVTPYLMVKDARKAIAFYKEAFGAIEESVMEIDGNVMHARIKIGDSTLFMCEECPQMNKFSAETKGFATNSLMIYCDDVDALFERATKAGCTVSMPLMDMFWGDRYAHVVDPFKQEWGLATHKQDLSPKEIEANYRECMKHFDGGCGEKK